MPPRKAKVAILSESLLLETPDPDAIIANIQKDRLVRPSIRSERSLSDKPLRMTTRATSVQSRHSPDSVTQQSVYEDELDVDRPRKIARTLHARNGVHSSSGFRTTRVATMSQDDIQPDDASSDDQRLEDSDQMNDQSQEDEAESGDGSDEQRVKGTRSEIFESRRSTPMLDDRQQDPSRNSSTGPFAAKIKKTNLVQQRATRTPEQGTPEPDKKAGLIARLPGRRRAPHPDLDIEIDLRRQLELKVAYRAVAKALKPVLAELAERTARELDEDEKCHKAFPEYTEVISELNKSLADRIGVLRSQTAEEEGRLEREHEALKMLIYDRYQVEWYEYAENRLMECRRFVLSLLQESRSEQDSDGTDYEDEIMPGTYQIDPITRSRRHIAKGYESRSRESMEISQKWHELERRIAMRELQVAFDSTSLNTTPKDFAVYDGQKRREALASLNILQLACAGEEIEEISRHAPTTTIPNAEAVGLQILAYATKMDSLQEQASPKHEDRLEPRQSSPRTSTNTLQHPSSTESTNTRQSGTVSSQPAQKKNSSRRRKSPKFHPILVPQHYPYPGHIEQTGQVLPPPVYHQPYHFPMAPILSTHDQPSQPRHVQQENLNGRQSNTPPKTAQNVQPSSQAATVSHDFSAKIEEPNDLQPLLDASSAAKPVMETTFEYKPHTNSTKPQSWRSFQTPVAPSNTILPKYIKENGLVRPDTDTTSPIAAKTGHTKSGPEWPGFSTNSSANHGRAASYDAEIAQRSIFPGLVETMHLTQETSQQKQSRQEPGNPPGPGPDMNLRGRSPEKPPTEDRQSFGLPQSSEPSPFFQPSGSASSFRLFNSRPTDQPQSYHIASNGVERSRPQPPSSFNQHSTASSPSANSPSALSPSISTHGTVMPGHGSQTIGFSQPAQRRNLDKRGSRPTTPSSSTSRFPAPHNSSNEFHQPSLNLFPHSSSQQTRSPLPPLAPQPSFTSRMPPANQQSSSRSGNYHQRILPASMDPSRRSSASGTSEQYPPVSSPNDHFNYQQHSFSVSSNPLKFAPAYVPAVSSTGTHTSLVSTSFRDNTSSSQFPRQSPVAAGKNSFSNGPMLNIQSQHNYQTPNQQRGQALATPTPSPVTTTTQQTASKPKEHKWHIYANIAPAPQTSASQRQHGHTSQHDRAQSHAQTNPRSQTIQSQETSSRRELVPQGQIQSQEGQQQQQQQLPATQAQGQPRPQNPSGSNDNAGGNENSTGEKDKQ